MGAKLVAIVPRQRAAKAAQRRLRDARKLVESALWNLAYNDDPLLGSDAVRAVWRDLFLRLDQALDPERDG
jgi:hypothetical protein